MESENLHSVARLAKNVLANAQMPSPYFPKNARVRPARVLRVGLAVDACQVALHHAQRNPQVIGYLLERALVGGYGAQYFFLARGQAASADELGLHLLKCRRGRGGKARLDGLAFPDRGRQAEQPAPTNATLTSTNRISDAIITAAMPDCVSIMETPTR